jgi:hypothetical protein
MIECQLIRVPREFLHKPGPPRILVCPYCNRVLEGIDYGLICIAVWPRELGIQADYFQEPPLFAPLGKVFYSIPRPVTTGPMILTPEIITRLFSLQAETIGARLNVRRPRRFVGTLPTHPSSGCFRANGASSHANQEPKLPRLQADASGI